MFEQGHVGRDGAADQGRELGAVECGEAQLTADRTHEHRCGGEQSEAAATGECGGREGEQEDRSLRERNRQQAGDESAQHQMAWVPAQLVERARPAHLPSCARIAASFASPMPETSSSSSTEPMPPFCSR